MIGINELLDLKKVIDSTMEVEARRWSSHPDYGWIDMKFDAIDGTDYFQSDSMRGKASIYSWIQGRGLEALVTHIDWYGNFHGYDNPDVTKLRTIADTVYMKLTDAIRKNGGHAYFRFDENGYSSAEKDGRYTMSDLFCSRGIYQYSMKYGDAQAKKEGEQYLKATIDAILEGRFYNDQESFNASQYVKYEDGRTSYAGQMLALGGVVLLMRNSKLETAPSIGKSLVDYVFANHINVSGKGRKWDCLAKGTIVEWIKDGVPARNSDDSIALDPGHGLEFTGLCSQFINEFRKNYSLSKADRKWCTAIIESMPELIKANYRHGYKCGVGIAKGVNGETGESISPTMPWWAVPETMRALALVDSMLEKEDPWLLKTYAVCHRNFMKYFFKASPTGVAVQTVGEDRKPVPVIPATPDLDAGYHTGLSFITAYDVLAEKVKLGLQKARIDITPKGAHLLCGHAARRFRKAEKVMDPLYSNVLVLRSPYSQSVLVELDLIEFEEEFVVNMRKAVASAAHVSESSVVVASTHTHTAPAVIYIGTIPVDKKFEKQVMDKTVKGLASAVRKACIPVDVQVACTNTDFGINRRYKDPVTGTFSMKPNPTGPNDTSLPVVVFRSQNEKIEAVLFNCGVHPTTLGVSIFEISADYPGRIKKHLKAILGDDVLTVATTGACGDVRPAILSEDGLHFGDGTEADIERIGKTTAKAITKAIRKAQPVKGSSQSLMISEYVDFEMTDIPTKDEIRKRLEAVTEKLAEAQKIAEGMTEFERLHDDPVWAIGADKEWLENMLERPEPFDTTVKGQVVLWVINGQIALFCVPGELFTEVGMKLKSLWDGKLSVIIGYSNGSLGYLPSASAVNEGGYEIVEAFKHVGHNGRFSEQFEAKLLSVLREMIEKV